MIQPAAAHYSQIGEDIRFEIETENANFFANPGSIEIFPVAPGLVANAAKPSITIQDNTVIITQKNGELDINDIPNTDLVLTHENAEGQHKSVSVFAFRKERTEGAIAAPATEIKTPEVKKETTFGEAILLALLGGLILNLMPCVFPVLSLKALKLCQLNEKEESKARLNGLAYAAGVIISFLIIAGLLIVLKAAGAEIGWGFQLQSPAVVLFLAYLLFVLGLNLSGYFEIGGNFMNIGNKLAQRDGVSGSFFTGVLATAVATPCTAPFMVTALSFALVQPASISLIVFAMLGFGLALPYLVLCFVPAARTALPKPGPWMDTFKQFLAFPLFASAAWLIWVLSQQVDSTEILYALMGIVLLAMGIWIFRHKKKALATIILVISIIPLFVVHTDPSNTDIPQEIIKAQNWKSYTPDRLTIALEGDEPVFVNMTAAWCITCKYNELVALNLGSTKMLFAEHNIQYFKGDWTNRDSDITKFLEKYGRNGVPLYVYYGPRSGETGHRPEPIVLPQTLTPGLIRNTILNK